jgi:DNA-binding transcriptional LysR family regulator
VGAKSDDSSIFQQKLVKDEMCLVVPKGHKWFNKRSVSIEELFKEPYIIREEGSGTLKSLILSMQKKEYDIHNFNIIAEMGSTQAVLQGIKHHVGISILSTIAVEDDVRAGSLKTLNIDGLELERFFYFIRHKNRTPSPPSCSFEKKLFRSRTHLFQNRHSLK